jgi:hypothetical protein
LRRLPDLVLALIAGGGARTSPGRVSGGRPRRAGSLQTPPLGRSRRRVPGPSRPVVSGPQAEQRRYVAVRPGRKRPHHHYQDHPQRPFRARRESSDEPADPRRRDGVRPPPPPPARGWFRRAPQGPCVHAAGARAAERSQGPVQGPVGQPHIHEGRRPSPPSAPATARSPCPLPMCARKGSVGRWAATRTRRRRRKEYMTRTSWQATAWRAGTRPIRPGRRAGGGARWLLPRHDRVTVAVARQWAATRKRGGRRSASTMGRRTGGPIED